jgi:MoaA/NifB/PqqE/SkfB family radical SAM enzyme
VLSTNGYGIANADDPEDVLHRLHEAGVRMLSLTLHGERQCHDWFVRRPGAFDDIWQSARLCARCGIRTFFNFYVDRRNVADFEPFLERVAALDDESEGDSETWLGVPGFLATPRLRAYEQTLRPRLADLEPIRHHVAQHWGGNLEDYTEGNWAGRLLDLADPLTRPQQSSRNRQSVAFVVDAAFDVYEKPWLFEYSPVLHGNAKDEGLDAVIERYLAWEPLQYPGVTELAGLYGDRGSNLLHRNPASLYVKWIDRWLAEHGGAPA